MRGRPLPIQFVVFGIILFIGAGVLAFLFWPQKVTPITPDPSLANAAAISKSDSDSDGLLDWEETLLSTNPNKADTDGDGAFDGEEVRTKRNPLIPGPNDLVSVATSSPLTLATISQEGTLTDQIAKDLVTTLINYQQTGKLDSTHEKQLVNTLIDSSNKRVLTEKYGAGDIIIATTESTSTRKAYREAINLALASTKSITANELLIVGESVEKKTKEAKQRADDLITIYKKITVDLSKVSVPPSAVQTHLLLLNGFDAYTNALDGIRTLEVDPVLAAVVIQNYQAIELNLRNSGLALATYFQTYKVN